MRVLWVCNIILPIIAQKLHIEYSVREGWLTGTLNRLISSNNSDIVLGICFPVTEELADFHETFSFSDYPIECYGFIENLNNPEIYDEGMEMQFSSIIKTFHPDIIHVFGTEFPHTLAVAKTFNNPGRILIGLQGIISLCAENYYADLPNKIIHYSTFRDLIKKDNIEKQKEKFDLRGKHEIEALKLVRNITGRTEFDKQAAASINSDANYYSMNETMRSPFYSDKWELEYCRKHRIFFSQADYPLKGFHYLLQAMPKILLHYPDTEVVVAGKSIVKSRTLKDRIKIGGYGKYLRSYINEWELGFRIEFLGKLSAEEMKEQYLQCHTYVCASSLENSPNSMAEAMLLGVPVVASNTGGIPSMITDYQDGLLFQKGNSEQLALRIIELWDNEELENQISLNAQNRAFLTYNPDKNYERLIEIYNDIVK